MIFFTPTPVSFPISFWELKGLHAYQFFIHPRSNWQTIPKVKDDKQSLSIIPDVKYTLNVSVIDNKCKYYVLLLLGKHILYLLVKIY